MAGHTAKRVVLFTMAVTELVALSVIAGTIGYFIEQYKKLADDEGEDGQNILDSGMLGREEFLLFSAGAGIFVAIFSMTIAIAGRQEQVHWAVLASTLHAFCAVALLVSASLLAKTVATFDSNELCTVWKESSSDARCYQLTIGVVFGFVSMVLFIADTIIFVFTLIQNPGVSFANMEN